MRYNWVSANLLPALMPWVSLLILLVLKPNRLASAWWVLAPFALISVTMSLLKSSLPFVPSETADVCDQIVSALALGLAGAWLLSCHLGAKHRFLTLFAMLGILLGLGLLSLLFGLGLDQSSADELLPLVLVVALGALVISLALTLSGLLCRGRYRPLRLCLWLALTLVAAWFVVICPFLVFARMMGQLGQGFALQMFLVTLCASGPTFGILLPFLLLSFANTLYRDRLRNLLHLAPDPSPPAAAPPQPAAQVAEAS